MLPLSIQYLPSSHRPAFFFCPARLAQSMGTIYCTPTLKEKDTRFPLTELKDSTINPAPSAPSSPFALPSSRIKGHGQPRHLLCMSIPLSCSPAPPAHEAGCPGSVWIQ